MALAKNIFFNILAKAILILSSIIRRLKPTAMKAEADGNES